MLRKLFCGLMAAGLLLATSCQQQEFTPALGEATVTFEVATPEIATRADAYDYSDGTHATKLQYAVYHMNGTEYGTMSHVTTTGAEIHGSTTLSLQLTAGETYQIILWAAAEGAPYAVDFGTKTMTVSYTDAVSNDETRDAFYAVHEFTVNGTQTETVELKRPFAQLNIGTNDYAKAEAASGYVPTQSSVTVKGIYNTLNLANGTVSGTADVTFGFAAIDKTEAFPYDDTNYDYVAMNYVLVDKSLVEVEFAVAEGAEDNIVNPKTRTVASVPVQRNYRTNIYGSILTSDVDVNVEIKPGYEEDDTNNNNVELVGSTEDAQAALDNAVEGTTIQLQPNVSYGTLYIRPVDGKQNTVTGCDYLVWRNEMLRKVENLTILGASGATVDAIKVVAGYVENSGSTGYVVDIKNLVIESVKFTDDYKHPVHKYSSPLFFDLSYTNVNGLTVKNCELKGDNDKMNFVYFYGNGNPTNSTFKTAAKNITLEGNYVEGIARFCELRQAENVTLKDNTIKNTSLHAMLLSVDNGSYSRSVTITGNTADGIKERFVRMAGAGDAVVVIKDNLINNYHGADADYIKVTDGTNVTIENNVLGVSTAEALQYLCNIATGTTDIMLTADISGNVTVIQKPGVKISIDGDQHNYEGFIKVHSNSNHYADADLTIKHVNFKTSKVYKDSDDEPYFNFIEALENGSERYSTNITVDGCTFTATGDAVNEAVALQIKASKNAKALNCTATGLHSLVQAQSCDETVVVKGCTINGKNGVAFKQVKTATVEGTEITALEYGIRFDGNIDNYGITVKDNNVTAVQPLIVRKMTGINNTITLEGTNTLTTEAEYQIVITNGSDDQAYVKPTGTYTLTGADGFTIYPKPILAKVGNTEYDDIDEAIAAWAHNTTLTLIADVTLKDVIKISSTEYRILDLGTYTMTGANGKNAIEIINNGRSSASYTLDIKADATNPGGITASSAVVKTTGKSGVKDRPIIRFYNGVFNATNIISHSGSNGTNCPQFQFHGGVYNGSLYANRALIQIYGGTFNGTFTISVDSSAYALIAGGKFKYLDNLYGSALNAEKFTIGSAKGVFDRGVYVDDEGYIVVGGPVITEFGDKFAAKAKATNVRKAGTYLPYSSAAEHGLYYTNAEMAIAKHGAANVILK